MPSVLQEKDAIRELLARYCFHFDAGEFEEWLGLFAPDGVFDLGPQGRIGGRDALREFLTLVPLTDGLPMTRHGVMNIIINVDGERATARSYVLVMGGGERVSIGVAGRYEDQIVKIAGQWRFKERKVYFDLVPQCGDGR